MKTHLSHWIIGLAVMVLLCDFAMPVVGHAYEIDWMGSYARKQAYEKRMEDAKQAAERAREAAKKAAEAAREAAKN